MGFPDGPLTGAPINFPTPLVLPNVPFQSAYNATFGAAPDIVYKVQLGGSSTIVILGSSFVGPFSFSFVDINVAGNAGAAPSVVSVSSTETQIDLELSPDVAGADDMWGILLQDGKGDDYALPSPLRIVGGE